MEKYDFEELLKKCATEPIHLLGNIQKFACLIAVDDNLSIKAISENFNLSSKRIDKLLNFNIDVLIDQASLIKLKDFIKETEFITNSTITLSIDGEEYIFYGFKSGELTILEHEFKESNFESIKKDELINSLISYSIVKNDESALVKLGDNLVKNIKTLIGYDRVMLYKFHEDDHGEVIAESKEDNLEPFIGMHYPESDIPSQARRLYVRNQVRIIPDILGERIKIFSDIDPTTIDLSNSISRHVSPVHIEYLKNMKVNASLSISIVIDGRLWGLIACHHYSPKFISFSNRSFLKFVGHAFASEVSKVHSIKLSKRIQSVNMLTVSLIEALNKIKRRSAVNYLHKIIEPHTNSLLSLQAANGAYIEVGENIATVGKVPQKNVINFIKKKIEEKPNDPYFYTNSLSYYNSEFESISSDCSGVLSVGIASGESRCFIAWFRPETVEEVKWAGKDEKSIKYDGEVARLTPRGSFEEIVKTEKNCSLLFVQDDLEIGYEFLWFLNKVLLEQLKSAEESVVDLENQAKDKDNFISNLSHELRTPLNNILGWLQLYEDKLKKDPELNELRRVVQDNSDQQLKLVNDLLDVSKIASGKMELEFESKDIREYIANIESYFRPSFENKDITCELSLSDEPLVCSVDKVRFEQILRNIIQNALKFTPKHGAVKFTSYKDGSDVYIEIVDSGEGIEKKELKKVFRQFHQVDNEKSRTNDGLGLGLALVKNLIELHGGNIEISSEGVNKGTRVMLRFPIASTIDKNIKPKFKANSKNNNHGTSKLNDTYILLVEDTVESARFVKLFLEREGAKVDWLDNAHDALNAVKKNEYDLVVSDIGLPGMDGLEFIEFAKTNKEVSDIPFIALSAYGSDQEVQRSLDAGFNKHLVKPVSLTLLIEAITEELK